MQFEIDVTGLADTQQRLRKLESLLLRWDNAFKAVGNAFKQYYSTVPFASRGTVFGSAWAPLQPRYRTWKAKKYPGRPILVREGHLSKGYEFVSSGNMMRLFNRVEYFEKHQKGDGVPQRIMLALNQNRRQAAADIIRADLMRKMRSF